MILIKWQSTMAVPTSLHFSDKLYHNNMVGSYYVDMLKLYNKSGFTVTYSLDNSEVKAHLPVTSRVRTIGRTDRQTKLM